MLASVLVALLGTYSERERGRLRREVGTSQIT
jgi:hypothetical protein